jgi:hypothetical protein
MSTIRETVQENLGNAGLSSYVRQAEPVIAALEAREWDMADALVEAGTNLGATRSQVTGVLVDAGVQTRPQPVAVSNGSSNGDLFAQIDALRDSVNQINQALDQIVRTSR